MKLWRSVPGTQHTNRLGYAMVKYKDGWLGKGSDAYAMWEKKDFQALDKHLKKLDQDAKDLVKRYAEKK